MCAVEERNREAIREMLEKLSDEQLDRLARFLDELEGEVPDYQQSDEARPSTQIREAVYPLTATQQIGGEILAFYENYVRRCNAVGVSPSRVAQNIGLNKAAASYWKRGARPSFTSLLKIADYFKISVGELLGATKETAEEIAKQYGMSAELLLTDKGNAKAN